MNENKPINVNGGSPGILLKKVRPPEFVALIASKISLTEEVVFNEFRFSEAESEADPLLSVAEAAKEEGDS